MAIQECSEVHRWFKKMKDYINCWICRNRLDYSLGQIQIKREEDMFPIDAEQTLLFLPCFFKTSFCQNRLFPEQALLHVFLLYCIEEELIFASLKAMMNLHSHACTKLVDK